MLMTGRANPLCQWKLRLGRTFHGSATGQRRDTILARKFMGAHYKQIPPMRPCIQNSWFSRYSFLRKYYFTNSYFSDMLTGMTKTREQRDLFPGALEIMILQSLRRQPMHGYALVKHIQQASDNMLQVEEGSLYPALQRLLKEGLLQSEEGISAKGRPTRIYHVTDAGMRHLEQELSSFEKMFAGISRVLAEA